jgi:hypothetical protein
LSFRSEAKDLLTPARPNQKINLQKLAFFSTRKITTQTPHKSPRYHQFTTFYQPKTTSKPPYPQTLAL